MTNRLSGSEGFDVEQDTFLRGALAGSVAVCVGVVDRLRRAGHPRLEIVESILVPSLVAIGSMWERREISVGQEHLATAVCTRLVAYMFPPVVHGLDSTQRVMLASAPGNRHTLGLQVLANLLEARGIYTDFLAGETPASEVLEFARLIRPSVVGLSLSHTDQSASAKSLIHDLKKAMPRVRVIVGGIGGTDMAQATGADAAHQNLRSTLDLVAQWMVREEPTVRQQLARSFGT